ncbi:MAG: zinc ribbon domain-containing protein [Deltaproteobacteria bacterium]|nr:zinc ribbon domain-containing protein [Deltaproteobacteria bacterium]
MGQAVEVTCPKCSGKFVVNPHMLGSGMEFHCPFCGAYFPEEESPHIWK